MKEKNEIKILPESSVGRWSIFLSATLIILVLMALYANIILPLIDDYTIYPLSCVCLILGLIAILKKDKAILLFLPIFLGLLCIAWILFQIIYPDWR